jgi:hypothetical protein
MTSRRNFLRTAGGALLGAAAVSKAAQGAVPEAPIQTKPDMQPPLPMAVLTTRWLLSTAGPCPGA